MLYLNVQVFVQFFSPISFHVNPKFFNNLYIEAKLESSLQLHEIAFLVSSLNGVLQISFS
jgi:hypothetical protein